MTDPEGYSQLFQGKSRIMGTGPAGNPARGCSPGNFFREILGNNDLSPKKAPNRDFPSGASQNSSFLGHLGVFPLWEHRECRSQEFQVGTSPPRVGFGAFSRGLSPPKSQGSEAVNEPSLGQELIRSHIPKFPLKCGGAERKFQRE